VGQTRAKIKNARFRTTCGPPNAAKRAELGPADASEPPRTTWELDAADAIDFAT
jgi:hypothetical protein